MTTAKRKSSTKKATPNKVQQQWATAVKKLAQHQKTFQTKLKAIKKDIEKKVTEAETTIAKLINATKAKSSSKKVVAHSKSKTKAKKTTVKAKPRRSVTKAKKKQIRGMEAA